MHSECNIVLHSLTPCQEKGLNWARLLGYSIVIWLHFKVKSRTFFLRAGARLGLSALVAWAPGISGSSDMAMVTGIFY